MRHIQAEIEVWLGWGWRNPQYLLSRITCGGAIGYVEIREGWWGNKEFHQSLYQTHLQHSSASSWQIEGK